MVSEVASEICTKIGIKVYAGDGGFTIDGVEFNEYLELDAEPPEYKGYRTIPKISILDGVFYGKIVRSFSAGCANTGRHSRDWAEL